MPYYVYILKSLKTDNLYIGFTSDLKTRLSRHSKGLVNSTKKFLPYRLIHYEYFNNKMDALQREKYLKSGYGHSQINSILKQTLKSFSNQQPTFC